MLSEYKQAERQNNLKQKQMSQKQALISEEIDTSMYLMCFAGKYA